jgi:hypothetical protein
MESAHRRDWFADGTSLEERIGVSWSSPSCFTPNPVAHSITPLWMTASLTLSRYRQAKDAGAEQGNTGWFRD